MQAFTERRSYCLHLGMVDDADVHRGHAREERRPLLVDGLHHAVDGPRVGEDDQLGADVDGQAHRHRHAVDMEEGDRAHHPFFAFLQRAHPVLHLDRVDHQVVMGQHGGFGHAGRAAGVLEQRRVIRRDRDLRRRFGMRVQQLAEVVDPVALRHIHHLAVLLDGAFDQGVEGRGNVVGHIGNDDALDLRVGLDLLQLAVEAAEEDDGLRAGIAELVLDLARGVGGVGVDDNRAQLERAVEAR